MTTPDRHRDHPGYQLAPKPEQVLALVYEAAQATSNRKRCAGTTKAPGAERIQRRRSNKTSSTGRCNALASKTDRRASRHYGAPAR